MYSRLLFTKLLVIEVNVFDIVWCESEVGLQNAFQNFPRWVAYDFIFCVCCILPQHGTY